MVFALTRETTIADAIDHIEELISQVLIEFYGVNEDEDCDIPNLLEELPSKGTEQILLNDIVCCITQVSSHGGYEGGGDTVWRVYQFLIDSMPALYFRVKGFYSSYNGIEWDDNIEMVKPVEVTVIKYYTDREMMKHVQKTLSGE